MKFCGGSRRKWGYTVKRIRRKNAFEISKGTGFVAPGMVLLLAVTGYPLLQVVKMSFYDYSKFTSPKFYGLGNYLDIFKDSLFWNAIGNTVLFTIVSVSLILLLALLFAALLSAKIHPWLRGVLRTTLLLPWLFSSAVVSALWVIMLNPFGIINWLLMKLGIITDVIGWFGDERFALLAVVFTNVWRSFPFAMLMLLAGMQTVSEDIKEAAIVDGANSLQVFFYVVLPQIKNVIFTVGTLQFIWDFRSFDLIYIMTGGGPMNKTEVMSTLIYSAAFKKLDYGNASATAVIMLLLMLAFSAIYIRRSLRKEE